MLFASHTSCYNYDNLEEDQTKGHRALREKRESGQKGSKLKSKQLKVVNALESSHKGPVLSIYHNSVEAPVHLFGISVVGTEQQVEMRLKIVDCL